MAHIQIFEPGLVGGATVLTGRYPTRAELAAWTEVASVDTDETADTDDTAATSHRAAVQPEGSVRLLAMAGPGSITTAQGNAALITPTTEGADSGCCGGTGACC